jgi:hypothetical protein
LIEDAARINAQIPAELHAYRARVESEMSLILIDSAGRERTGQIEEIATDVRWRPADRYDQRVVGYRSQAVGPMFSLMSIFGGWTTPTLYGNQLQLGVTPTETVERIPAGEPRTALTVHPLASSRDSFYTFSSGDTAVVLYSRGRRIPVVRVRVTPRTDAKGDAILFFGDMYLDADRKQIVRMRGRMVELKNGRVTLKSGSKIPGVSGASFVEVENVEVNGQFWLPVYQRTEIQARFSVLGDFRAIVRIVSRFRDFKINDSSWSVLAETPGTGHHLSFAAADSVTKFKDWNRPLGAATTDAEYADFDDIAPASWTTSTRSVRFQPRALGDVFRFNRIEGVFTGIAAENHFRSSPPGTSMRGSLGWAWSEKTARGMLSVHHASSRSATGIRIERSLHSTNDFQLPLSGGATIPALLGSFDDFDYLDRRSVTLYGSRKVANQRSLMRLELGPGSDRVVTQHASRGLYVQGDGFQSNRGITPGKFFRTFASIELNPEVSGLFIDRGVGATLQYERGDGDLRWQRLELHTAARRELGPLQIFARANAGTLIGSPIPQQMFEIGSSEGLTGYDYKEFGGDRAAIGDAVVGYTFPFLRAPMHLPEQLIAPGIAPGIAVGIHGAWAEVSSAAAKNALRLLGTRTDSSSGEVVPLSRPTDGVRTSVEALATFFNGSIAIGVARPIDRAGHWKITGRIGLGF